MSARFLFGKDPDNVHQCDGTIKEGVVTTMSAKFVLGKDYPLMPVAEMLTACSLYRLVQQPRRPPPACSHSTAPQRCCVSRCSHAALACSSNVSVYFSEPLLRIESQQSDSMAGFRLLTYSTNASAGTLGLHNPVLGKGHVFLWSITAFQIECTE